MYCNSSLFNLIESGEANRGFIQDFQFQVNCLSNDVKVHQHTASAVQLEIERQPVVKFRLPRNLFSYPTRQLSSSRILNGDVHKLYLFQDDFQLLESIKKYCQLRNEATRSKAPILPSTCNQAISLVILEDIERNRLVGHFSAPSEGVTRVTSQLRSSIKLIHEEGVNKALCKQSAPKFDWVSGSFPKYPVPFKFDEK